MFNWTKKCETTTHHVINAKQRCRSWKDGSYYKSWALKQKKLIKILILSQYMDMEKKLNGCKMIKQLTTSWYSCVLLNEGASLAQYCAHGMQGNFLYNILLQQKIQCKNPKQVDKPLSCFINMSYS